ncbi:ABC transporter ATP-binding protein [Aromatoleum toluolicum]|uniref:ATP-binding cassette domain-containing protein n=1 Tax=Aromatoleum toluolicum TaxID=90060 RepID=A0ABX1NBR2_9RHOO|nr:MULTISPECIES: ABC transporter ATP-binding protein [Rhodocyclales]AKU14384.1 putative 3-methylbenzoate transporter ATPase [Azoarcus sp. CIB]AYH45985.1 ABC transporter ATP-binding protein [Azoarcus sp. DN11]NMF96655.1 ABC transporter ATP-binding protein [Aromatoleum toluolicum]CCH23035.1 putative 3-methylbenzoate transporter ATPase [Azoarcus sp. CIB]
MSEPILRTTELTKHFGGLAAVNQVSLDFYAGQVHALLGPNGAGKSTFINLLSGDLKPSGGEVSLAGCAIEGLSPEKISRMGVGRTYQKTNIFPAFTVFENARLAAQSRRPHAFHLFRHALACGDTLELAEKVLAMGELTHRRNDMAAILSHGEQRQLEIAMALATEPQVLLLDEPLAGMGATESAAMVRLLKKLAEDHAILLVEHDMDAVFAVADVVTVMVNGTVLESGSPGAIRASAAVQEAYLGAEEDESHEPLVA